MNVVDHCCYLNHLIDGLKHLQAFWGCYIGSYLFRFAIYK